jgi:hypothetical protein
MTIETVVADQIEQLKASCLEELRVLDDIPIKTAEAAEEIARKRRFYNERLERIKVGIASLSCCPVCWVSDGRTIALHTIPSENSDDLFRCSNCDRVYVVPDPR